MFIREGESVTQCILVDIMHIVRRSIRRLGWDIHRHSERPKVEALSSMLKLHNVNVVFDVGANCGQYATKLRSRGYTGRIVSFEPLTEPHSRLTEASKGDPRWTAAERMALGPARALASINVAGNNSESSSMLPMLEAHNEVAPEAAYIGTETVDVFPLDDIAHKYLAPDDNLFLKLDVQGFESAVLDGSPNTLARAVGIQFEISLAPLYEGQPSFVSMFERMTKLGFDPWNIIPELIHPGTGQMLQCDCVFFRPIKPS
jgi:FkbM family methyltransferase